MTSCANVLAIECLPQNVGECLRTAEIPSEEIWAELREKQGKRAKSALQSLNGLLSLTGCARIG